MFSKASSRLIAFVLPLTAATLITTDNIASLRNEYDYIIVGGGASGLTVANRLTEDKSINVLVLEAGPLDDDAPDVMAPGSIGRANTNRYNWNMTTVPQTFLNNQNIWFPQGRVVGGGTILNGLAWTRASSSDFDSWVSLGNEGWGWADLWPYFKKSETFNDVVSDYGTDTLQIDPGMDTHGTNGPIQVGYPKYFYAPQSENFLNGVEELGIPRIGEPNSGNMTGASVLPSSLSLDRQARHSARNAYYDPAVGRQNLHVAIDQRVTRVILTNDETPVATGVEFAQNADAQRSTVSCTREVILAAGGVFSPVVLQVSGIGPRALLESIGVDVRVDLPGVGNNLQDHPMIQEEYRYSEQGLYTSSSLTNDDLQNWEDNAAGPYTAPMVNACAFPSFATVATDHAARIEAVRNGSVTGVLPDSYDRTLRDGYEAQVAVTLGLLGQSNVAAYELMSTSYGQLTASVMQPLSRGNVTASSSNVFDTPRIDPRFLSHQFDREMLEIGLRFNDDLVATESMRGLAALPVAGLGPDATEEEYQTAINKLVITNFHPSCSNAMMPLHHGGVVDTQLSVYGTKGLRIVDASVMPSIPGGHLQAVVYAIAEKAADVIKAAQT